MSAATTLGAQPHITLETNLFKDGWVEPVNESYELLAGQITAATDGGASGKPPPIDIGDFADTCLLCYAVVLHMPVPPEPEKKKKQRKRFHQRLPTEKNLTLFEEFERTKGTAAWEAKLKMEIDAKVSLEEFADSAFRPRRQGNAYFNLSDDEEEEEEEEVTLPIPGNVIEHLIGLVYLRTTPHNSEATVGVSIRTSWRGKGHAVTAVEKVLSQAFGLFGFHRVVASIPESVVMHRAVRTFMRLGFTHEGLRRKASFCPIEHTWKDVTSLALLDTDYSIREAQSRAGRVVARSPWDELMDRHERERNALMDNEALQPDGSFDGMLMEEIVMEGGKMVKRTRSTETIRNVNRAGGSGNNREREMKKLSQAMWDDSPAPTPSASGSECSSPPRSQCASLPDSPKGFDEDMSMDEDDLYMDSKTPASGGEDLRKVWAHAVGSGVGAGPSFSSPPKPAQLSPTRSTLPTQRTPPMTALPPLPSSPTSPSSSRSSFSFASAPAPAVDSTLAQLSAFSTAEADAIRDLFSDPEDDSEIDWEEVDDDEDNVSVIASDLDGSIAGTSDSGSVISSVSGVRSLTSDDDDAEGEDEV